MNKALDPNITLGGRVSAPVSKSAAHRLLICAALANSPCKIICPATNDDIDATARCLRALGAGIEYKNGVFFVDPIKEPSANALLDCAESGSTLRFLLPVAASLGADSVFIGKGRLPERPLSPLYELMVNNGVFLSEKGKMPLFSRGRLDAAHFAIDGSVSSQFITGLLLACPAMHHPVSIEIVGRCESAPYIDITLACLERFGIKVCRQDNIITVEGEYASPESVTVEGDWSGAAFWLCAGLLSDNEISVSGLDHLSPQGDRRIVDALSSLGGVITSEGDTFTAHPSSLHAGVIDCADIPDLVPILAVAASFAKGRTLFENTARLRAKESDRAAAICDMLTRFGISCTAAENSITVIGGSPSGSLIDSFADHRIAMAGTVLAVSSGCAATILKSRCVSKSYPDFFKDLEKLTIKP